MYIVLSLLKIRKTTVVMMIIIIRIITSIILFISLVLIGNSRKVTFISSKKKNKSWVCLIVLVREYLLVSFYLKINWSSKCSLS